MKQTSPPLLFPQLYCLVLVVNGDPLRNNGRVWDPRVKLSLCENHNIALLSVLLKSHPASEFIQLILQ